MTKFSYLQAKHTIASIAVASILTACGGGGGGGNNSSSGQDVADTQPPSLTLSSPTKSAATTSETIEVTGTASDAASQVSSVTVNGINANSDDGFATWTAIIPIGAGLSALNINAEDSQGNVGSLVTNIEISKINGVFSSIESLLINTNTQQLIINDSAGQKVFTSDLQAPDLGTLDLNTSGTPALLSESRQATIADGQSNAFIIDTAQNDRDQFEQIQQFDTSSGNLSSLINLNNVSGLGRVIDIAIAPDEQNIYLLVEQNNSRNGGSIWVHNIATSSTSQLAQTENHSNSNFGIPSNLVVSQDGSRLFYLDNDALLSLDLGTNQLSTVSARGGNVTLARPNDMAIDPLNQRAWISDGSAKVIIQIDLSNGTRQILSANDTQAGPLFESPDQIVLAPDGSQLFVSDSNLNLIFSVSIADGQREYHISNRAGTGPSFDAPADIAVSDDSSFALVTDAGLDSVVRVNLATGDRQIISGLLPDGQNSVGFGPPLSAPKSIVLSEALNQAWVSDSEQGSVIALDLAGGDRTALSLSYNSGASNILKPVGLALDSANSALLVSDLFSDNLQNIDLGDNSVNAVGSGVLNDGNEIEKLIAITRISDLQTVYGIDTLLRGVVEWDLNTNLARVISRVFAGTGPNFASPYDIELSADSSVAYVSDTNLKAIFQVELADPNKGNRSILSSDTVGTGPSFIEPAGIQLDASNNRLLVADRKSKAIYSVALDTGNRTILSR